MSARAAQEPPPPPSGVLLAAARRITAASRFAFGIARWGVWAIAALMLWEVISRYAISSPTSWAPELATLLMAQALAEVVFSVFGHRRDAA